ncbi:acid protease [Gloeophyllum trabeum ATCC 11539]|uniref:Acid protease n=1 Tax=Gloeophyllum trabeum (strain ATCC 11539 / FP-39264 / Madison 617) TaxID=670483 RepID=S7RGH1_GLOTA|nr:acid protease [Gloeophyllum trabeum ATCC 11539]EPQ51649.1 acid protease [Gloeophyllum trabeum ATCC 11539]
MRSCIPNVLLVSLLSTSAVICSPAPSAPPSKGTTIPLTRRSVHKRSAAEWDEWAVRHREYVTKKYNGQVKSKRASGMNLLTDQDADSDYYGSVAIGTPAVSYNVILDTGSSDLWLASSSCSGCASSSGGGPTSAASNSIPLFDPASSSTFKNLTTPFAIQYASGQATGTLGQDTVQVAGFQVSDQTFGVCDTANGVLSSPLSGLMGLAWQSLASSKATPVWQTLAASGQWDSGVMGFFLTRFGNDSHAKELEPGGQFSMGYVNDSLYTGSIDYQNVPSDQVAYWTLPVTSLTVQGKSISLPTSGSNQYAAIDTGTTLIGGPSDLVQSLYSNIDGAQAGTGSWEGYWFYPCSTSVSSSISFGGPSWSISPDDFEHTQVDSSGTQCVGAFFEVNTGDNTPGWIVGDAFLKNVYTAFRYSPPSVGFASLSSTALGENGVDGIAPSATIGSPAAVVSSTGKASSNKNDATRSRGFSVQILALVWGAAGGLLLA